MKWGTLFFNNGFPLAITTMVNLMLHSMECSVDASAAASIKLIEYRIVYGTSVLYDYTRLGLGLDSISLNV